MQILKHMLLAMLGAAGVAWAQSSSSASCTTIYDLAKSTPSLSLLTKALESGNLVDLVDDDSLVATVFAPTDDAITSVRGVLALHPR